MGSNSIRGIEHIIGFNWLTAFMGWSPAFRLPFMSLLVLVLVGAPWLLGAGIVDSATLLVSIVMTGSIIAVLVILARGAQDDLLSAGGENLVVDLGANPRGRSVETPAGVLLGLISSTYFSAVFEGDKFAWLQILNADYYDSHSAGTIINQWLLIICILLAGLLIVYGIAYSLRQIRVFSTWARTISIDLIHTEELQVFTLQPLRYLLITVLFASLNIIAYQVLSVLDLAEQAMSAQLPLVLVMIACGFPFLRPVNLVRQRIASAKSMELRAVREALGGDRSALEHSQIAHARDEFKTPDLMFYEQQIKSIWEWPIQGYVQRILLYVLLPPLAWVLAALVEQLVDAFIS